MNVGDPYIPLMTLPFEQDFLRNVMLPVKVTKWYCFLMQCVSWSASGEKTLFKAV